LAAALQAAGCGRALRSNHLHLACLVSCLCQAWFHTDMLVDRVCSQLFRIVQQGLCERCAQAICTWRAW
jgi:hypothetical protein